MAIENELVVTKQNRANEINIIINEKLKKLTLETAANFHDKFPVKQWFQKSMMQYVLRFILNSN